MCGIAGIVYIERKNASIKEAVYSMSRTIAHRGPDDEGFALFAEDHVSVLGSSHTQQRVLDAGLSYTPKEKIEATGNDHSFVALAHRRLSILDLSPSGHQPMCNRAGNNWITFNGEIYNYIEIRKELQQAGFIFETQSDTEVILAAYEKWGTDCVKKFNGMWSFVIFDRQKKLLFASRDRFGVKPFYYYFKDGFFCFASEQKAICQLPFVETSIHKKAVYDFFAHNEEEYEEEGFFKNILELFPSTNLLLDLNTKELKKENYYSLQITSAFEDFSESKYKQYIHETEELFMDSIRLRLRSDVPVGCCLSGGIDSSAIAGAMNTLQGNEGLHLFSAVFPNESIDESKWAKLVANNTKSTWHTITPDGNELLDELQNLVYCQDIPLWSTSTYAQFKVMELVKQNGIKVVLDGQGGDELFAGYAPYFTYYWNEIAANKSGAAALKEVQKKGKLSKEATFWLKENAKKKESGLLAGLKSLKKQPKSWLSKNFVNEHKGKRSGADPASLNEILKQEFVNTRLKLYLKCEDRCGMWHSVESRTPFADDLPMIENTFKIAGSYKLHNGISKSLLRDATKNLLPKAIYERKDKMGYVTPNNKWLSENKSKIKELLHKDLGEYIDLKKLHATIDQLSGQQHEQTIVFKALTFSVWKSRFNM
jgi:asparagine synthase (glutamine-hydrolysing)